MKKINLKGRLDLNKQTVSRLNENEKSNYVGGKTTKGCGHSNMTIRDTLSCHCDSKVAEKYTGCYCVDSAMTVRDTLTCHCDEKTKTKGC